MNFVAECTTMSAPCSIGRQRYGVANVESTMGGAPMPWAISATPAISRTLPPGFPIVSPYRTFVFVRSAVRLQVEVRGGRLRVFEHVRGRLEDRRRPRPGVRVRPLAGVDGPGLEPECAGPLLAFAALVPHQATFSPTRSRNAVISRVISASSRRNESWP